jgi:pilus assembly protein CpaB
MNNTVLRALSVVLGLGALVVGLLAIKLSQGPSAPAPIAASQPTAVPVVAVATSVRTLKAGQVIVVSDIAIKGVQGPPTDAFRMTAVDIAPGTPLVPAHLAADSIAYLLKSGERAVGIQVDEVSSVGGFIKPGEHVDVLAYVPSTEDRNSRLGTATVVIQDARLLTIGDLSKLDQDASQGKDSVGTTLSKETGVKIVADIQERRLRLKSAVLAVKELDVNRLMTAATVGQLRLSLRPPAALDTLSLAGQGKPQLLPPPSTPLDMTIKRPKEKEEGRSVIIQEGSKERELGGNNKNSNL